LAWVSLLCWSRFPGSPPCGFDFGPRPMPAEAAMERRRAERAEAEWRVLRARSAQPLASPRPDSGTRRLPCVDGGRRLIVERLVQPLLIVEVEVRLQVRPSARHAAVVL